MLTVWLILALTAPESVSLQLQLTVTFVLFQPFEFAAVRETKLMTGLVVSRLMVTLFVAVPPALVAEQVKVMPFVSAVTVCMSQSV